jgi:hypothetical protein
VSFSLSRRVEHELLDALAADDPRAQRSRADLRRIHRAMATLPILLRALDRGTQGVVPRSILELGAGDGSLMLRVAQQRAPHWPDVRVTLLDRLNLVGPHTLDGMREVGWAPRLLAMDVFDWLRGRDRAHWDVVVANLFVHHFSSAELARLFAGIAARTRVFVCCEPRRSAVALAGSHVIGLLGAGPVTRRDAVTSVHAGFRAQELSNLWPGRQDWVLNEYRAGFFSHCFIARQKER